MSRQLRSGIFNRGLSTRCYCSAFVRFLADGNSRRCALASGFVQSRCGSRRLRLVCGDWAGPCRQRYEAFLFGLSGRVAPKTSCGKKYGRPLGRPYRMRRSRCLFRLCGTHDDLHQVAVVEHLLGQSLYIGVGEFAQGLFVVGEVVGAVRVLRLYVAHPAVVLL